MNPHASLDKPDRTITLLPNAQGTVDVTHVGALHRVALENTIMTDS